MAGTVALRQVVLDCPDARRLAEFYRQLLGFDYRPGDEPPAPDEPDPRGQDWLVLRNPAGGMQVAFQQVNRTRLTDRLVHLSRGAAVELATGADRIVASAWLGVLRAHQSRVAEALRLLRPVTRYSGVEHTSALLHALLFTGHAWALAGSPQAALSAFEQYTAEVERRQVPRFAGRGVNFGGWVLRSTGAIAQGVDHHLEALETADNGGITEVRIAALEDLAEARLVADDPDGAAALIGKASSALNGDLVFGWRLEFKLRLLQGRLALDTGLPREATAIAEALNADATGMRVPRYAAVARLLAHRARARQGLPTDPAAVESALDLLDSCMALESWWWTGETAADLGSSRLLARAEDRVARLAREIGPRATELHRDADRRLDRWRTVISSRPARP